MVTLAALLSMSASNYSEKLRRKISELVTEVNGGEPGLCRPTYDTWSINRDVEEIAEKEPEYLVLGGGDGSILFYLKRLKEIYGERSLPKLVYLPIGRENRLGYELGNSKRPIKLLEEIIERIKEGGRGLEEERMSLIEARIDEGKKKPTFDLGFGFVTNLLLHYYGIKAETVKRRKEDEFRNRAYPRRKMDSFKTFGGAVFNALRYWTQTAKEYFGGGMVEIKTNKVNYGRQYWLGGVMATNRHLWRGFKPMYRGREQAEKMHLIVTARAPIWLALKLRKLYRGGPIGGNTIDEVVEKTELTFGEPTVIQMAGEFLVAEQVEMEVEREGVCFVKPGEKKR